MMKQRIGYSGQELIIYFLLFSHLGWLWEVIIVYWQMGIWVNRGFMHGPWLPVYGTGVIALLIILGRSRKKIPELFFYSAVICGTLEYITAVLLEIFFNQKWWDYSGAFLSVQGKTCFAALILFGCAGCLLIRLLVPLMDRVMGKIVDRKRRLVCQIAGSVFLLDYGLSLLMPNQGLGITF